VTFCSCGLHRTPMLLVHRPIPRCNGRAVRPISVSTSSKTTN
jgi:hypothetical protein